MTENRLSDSSVRIMKTSAIVLGCLMILVAMLSNVLGLSIGSGLSRNQIGFAVAGVILIISGVLGKRFPLFYRGAALMLLNIILALVLLDFASLVIVKLINAEKFSIMEKKIEHVDFRDTEHSVIVSSYIPYVMWRSNPSCPGDPVTIDDNGFRITPEASRSPDAFSVFMFGGSAMWGANVNDSCTIAAYLQKDLSEMIERPVAVSNLASNAHTSTQEVIELVFQLREGNIPDLVVFYDGFNDVWAAYESGRVGVHHSFDVIAARIEGHPEAMGTRSPIELILRNSNTWLLVTSLRDKGILSVEDTPEIQSYRTRGMDSDSLASEVVDIYLNNCSIIKHLAYAYDFNYLIVWQPNIWCGDKKLTVSEQRIYDGDFEFYPAGRDPALRELLAASYSRFETSLPDSLHYFSFSAVFDSIEEEIYIDPFGPHINEWANGMIAGKLLDLVMEVCPEIPDIH